MNNKNIDSVGSGNIVQEYGDIGVQFLNIGFKKEGLFAYCKDTLHNYHSIKLERKYIFHSNKQYESCLYGKLEEYFGIVDIVIFKTTIIKDAISNKVVEIGEIIFTDELPYQFQINAHIQLNDFDKYSIFRIDKNYIAVMYLPENNFINYEFLTEFKDYYSENIYTQDYDVEVFQPYGFKVDEIIDNNFLSFNEYLIFQKKIKKEFEEYSRNLEIETDDNSREIKDEDKWDSFNSEEKMHLDPDRWTDEILDESDKREAEKLDEENNKHDKRKRYEKDYNNSIITNKSLLFLGRDSSIYDFGHEYSKITVWVPSLISYSFNDEMYEIDLVSYHPELLVEDEPQKYDYEYGRYKNVFVFVILKSEIERHKQLDVNEGNLESFLTKIKQEYDLDTLTITSESDGSYIITSYIKPTLYKENIKEDNLPF